MGPLAAPRAPVQKGQAPEGLDWRLALLLQAALGMAVRRAHSLAQGVVLRAHSWAQGVVLKDHS